MRSSFVLYESDMKPSIWRWICDDLGKEPSCRCEPCPEELYVTIELREDK